MGNERLSRHHVHTDQIAPLNDGYDLTFCSDLLGKNKAAYFDRKSGELHLEKPINAKIDDGKVDLQGVGDLHKIIKDLKAQSEWKDWSQGNGRVKPLQFNDHRSGTLVDGSVKCVYKRDANICKVVTRFSAICRKDKNRAGYEYSKLQFAHHLPVLSSGGRFKHLVSAKIDTPAFVDIYHKLYVVATYQQQDYLQIDIAGSKRFVGKRLDLNLTLEYFHKDPV